MKFSMNSLKKSSNYMGLVLLAMWAVFKTAVGEWLVGGLYYPVPVYIGDFNNHNNPRTGNPEVIQPV